MTRPTSRAELEVVLLDVERNAARASTDAIRAWWQQSADTLRARLAALDAHRSGEPEDAA